MGDIAPKIRELAGSAFRLSARKTKTRDSATQRRFDDLWSSQHEVQRDLAPTHPDQ
jgi:hypothetical protein